MSELKAHNINDLSLHDIANCYFYLKSEADKYIGELQKEIESMKVKFREFNDYVCKKIVDASKTMSAISQDAQMAFYEEFIRGEK